MLDDIAPRLEASPVIPPAAGRPPAYTSRAGNRSPSPPAPAPRQTARTTVVPHPTPGHRGGTSRRPPGFFRGDCSCIEPVLFGDRKIEPEALDAVHHLAPLDGERLHQVIEEDIEQHDNEDADDCRQGGGLGEGPQAEGLAGEEGDRKRDQEESSEDLGQVPRTAGQNPSPGPDRAIDERGAADRPAGQPDGHESGHDPVPAQDHDGRQGGDGQRQAGDQGPAVGRESRSSRTPPPGFSAVA